METEQILQVELHAQQHYGDRNYFEYWNSNKKFNDRHDCILFELLVDDELLRYETEKDCEYDNDNDSHHNKNNSNNNNTSTSTNTWQRRVVTKPIMASGNDQKFARNLGLQCQASVLNYTHPQWQHADLSRQEFTQRATATAAAGGTTTAITNTKTPLWKVAERSDSSSTLSSSSSTANEAVVALITGPPTLDYYGGNGRRQRRLFTNLFLSGGRLAFALRAILWISIPAPELSVILLDWSSLVQGGNKNTNYGGRSRSGVGVENNYPSGITVLSEVAIPILTSLVKFDISQMRRFLFGQVLMSSSKENNNESSPSWSLLVIDRNDHALNVLQENLEMINNKNNNNNNNNNINTAKSVALLYGSSHCPDLHNKLVTMGFQPIETIWRTAWSVQESGSPSSIPSASSFSSSSSSSSSSFFDYDDSRKDNIDTTTTNSNSNSKRELPAIGIFLLFYLSIGALDWVGIVGDTTSDLLGSNYFEAITGVVLYLIRHVLLYVGLSKFLIDWTDDNNNMNNT